MKETQFHLFHIFSGFLDFWVWKLLTGFLDFLPDFAGFSWILHRVYEDFLSEMPLDVECCGRTENSLYFQMSP